jgi:hypothetical protein
MIGTKDIRRSHSVAWILAALLGMSGILSAIAPAALHGLALHHYGAKVDATTGANFCDLLSGDTCQLGQRSSVAGGFGEFGPPGVAVSPTGNLYIADSAADRIQEVTATGKFVLMFGKDVNETTGGNVCTQAEVEAGAKCKTGGTGEEAGAFIGVESVAVDPVSGNVYVAESWFGNNRVDEFTASGKFVLTIGEHVNATTGANLCTQVEVEAGETCKGAPVGGESGEHGALLMLEGGNEIAAGGPKDILYVGTYHRVQEFNATGSWVGEISLTGISEGSLATAKALAVDQVTGDVYLVYPQNNETPAGIVYEFPEAGGAPLKEFTLTPRQAGATVNVESIALDANGHLIVAELESGSWFGSLLSATSGNRLAEFPILPAVLPAGLFPSITPALAFHSGELEFYGVAPWRREIVGYAFREGAEVLAKPASCSEGAAQESSVTFDCTLKAEVNPSGVSETEAWFRWATNPALGGPGTQETAKQPLATGNALVSVNAGLEGLLPAATYYYAVAAEDKNFKPPIPAITSETVLVKTPVVPPVIVGPPSALFVKSSSTVMSAELNPENTNTEYFFEYGQGEQLAKCTGSLAIKKECVGVALTPAVSSNIYGKIGSTQEVVGLQSNTVYHYRFTAVAEKGAGARTQGPEGEFTTAHAPEPFAETGAPNGITATTASISGKVTPDGQPAVYSFELGVYNGAGTQYGTVFSGSAGEGTSPVNEELSLSGLQPGTTYAYRIAISSGYVKGLTNTLQGLPRTFTTAGLPSVLVRPSLIPQLPTPKISFPCKSGFEHNKHGVCVKSKKSKNAKNRKVKPRHRRRSRGR